MRRKLNLGIGAILLLAGAAAAAAGIPSESGAPVAGEVVGISVSGIVSDGPDDAGVTRTTVGDLPVATTGIEAVGIEPTATPDRRVSDFLAGLADSKRGGAVIELELPTGTAADAVERVATVDRLWAAGRFDEAIDAVRALEDDEIGVDVAVSYLDPVPVEGPTLGSNVRVTATVSGEAATDTAVDVDRHTGNLFVMGRAAGAFSIYRSINGGTTWAETAYWCCDPGQVDLAIAASWGYVVYDVPTSNEVRMRRVFGTTGAFDGTYFWKPVGLHSGLTVTELVMVGNADVFDNRIYTAVRLSNSTVAWWWSDATVGDTFNRVDPGVTDAAGGLGMSYVHGWDGTGAYLHLSYRSGAGAAWVRSRGDGSWSGGTMLVADLYASSTTSVSAWDETVLVGYCQTVTEGVGAFYRISYDDGATWNVGTLASPAEGGDFFNPLVSARSGTGTAMVAQEEAGTLDRIDFRQRFNFQPGGWAALQPLNDVDFLTGASSIDFEYLHTGWGVTYLSPTGEVWFTLSRALFYSGLERGTTADWSVATP